MPDFGSYYCLRMGSFFRMRGVWIYWQGALFGKVVVRLWKDLKKRALVLFLGVPALFMLMEKITQWKWGKQGSLDGGASFYLNGGKKESGWKHQSCLTLPCVCVLLNWTFSNSFHLDAPKEYKKTSLLFSFSKVPLHKNHRKGRDTILIPLELGGYH